MELKQLRYFIAIAEQGSLSAAARRLHIVQPALSQALAVLERELGAELFTRSHGGVVLTRAGSELLHHARSILKQASFAKTAVQSLMEDARGPINIGILHSAASTVCEQLFRKLRTEAPLIQPQLVVGYSNDLSTRLQKGELDLSMIVVGARQYCAPDALLYEERLHLLTPRTGVSSPPQYELTLRDIQDLPLILSMAQPLHRALLAAAKDEKLELNIVGGVEDITSLVAICNACQVSTLLPETLSKSLAQDTSLVTMPIAHPALARRIGLYTSEIIPRSTSIIAVQNVFRALFQHAPDLHHSL